jgi:SNF2 family DNA or RNA helicase
MKHDHLYDYQRDAVGFLASRKNALLAHEPGLGKTATAIAASDNVKAERILVLCQAVGKSHWAKEFTRFQKVPRSVAIIHKATQAVPKEGIVIVNYDLISRTDSYLLKRLTASRWDVLICDEAHALKARKANRTQAVYGKRCDKTTGIASVCQHVWLLTGTPMPSNASELWTHLRALTPKVIEQVPGMPMNESQFIDRFCTWRDTPFGRQITGSRHLPDLRERMKDFMDRKKKTDVLADLPPLSFDTLVVHPHDAKHVPDAVLRELGNLDMALANHPEISATMDDGGADIFAVLSRLKTDTHITTQRRLTGTIKAEIALDVIEQELRGTQKKIIVFAHHTAVIDRLMAGLADMGAGAVKIDGRDDSTERDASVHAFQNDPLIRVFVGQITAAGTSITLTAASDVLFVEASWVPADNVQAACRAHRIGQKDGVLARFLTLDGSIDHQIMTALARKAREISELIDNETTITTAA